MVRAKPACQPLSDSMAVRGLRPGKSGQNPALSAHHVIVDKFLLSVSSPEKWGGGPGWSVKPFPTTWFSGCDSPARAALSCGWPSICANFSVHQREETNSPWARDGEFIAKSRLDKWEGIGFLFKEPGVLHSVCCSSINAGFLDHVYVHESF